MRILSLVTLVTAAATIAVGSSSAPLLGAPTELTLHKVIDVTRRVVGGAPTSFGSATPNAATPSIIFKGRLGIIEQLENPEKDFPAADSASSQVFFVPSKTLTKAFSASESYNTPTHLDTFVAALLSRPVTVVLEPHEVTEKFLNSIAHALLNVRFRASMYVLDRNSSAALQQLADSAAAATGSYVYLRRSPAAISSTKFPTAVDTLHTTALKNSYIAIHNHATKIDEKKSKKSATSTKNLPQGLLLTTTYDVMGITPSELAGNAAGIPSPAAAVVGATLHRLASMIGGISSAAEPAAVYGLMGHAGRLNDLSTVMLTEDATLGSALSGAIAFDADLLLAGADQKTFYLHMCKDYPSLNTDQAKPLQTFIKTLIASGASKGITFTTVVQKLNLTHYETRFQHERIETGLKLPSLTISSASKEEADSDNVQNVLRGLPRSVNNNKKVTASMVASSVVLLVGLVAEAVAAASGIPAASSSSNRGSIVGTPSEVVAEALLTASARSDRSTVSAVGIIPVQAGSSAGSFAKVIEELYTVTIPLAARKGHPNLGVSLNVATNMTPAVFVFDGSSNEPSVNTLQKVGLALSGPLTVQVEAYALPSTSSEVITSVGAFAYLIVFAVIMFGVSGAKKFVF